MLAPERTGAGLAGGFREIHHRRVPPELAVPGSLHLGEEPVLAYMGIFVEEEIHPPILGLDAGHVGVGEQIFPVQGIFGDEHFAQFGGQSIVMSLPELWG